MTLSTPPAVAFGEGNVRAFGFTSDEWKSLDAIVVNAAGCGAMLKEYGHILHASTELAAKFAAKVKDVSEFLVELGPVRPENPLIT